MEIVLYLNGTKYKVIAPKHNTSLNNSKIKSKIQSRKKITDDLMPKKY